MNISGSHYLKEVNYERQQIFTGWRNKVLQKH